MATAAFLAAWRRAGRQGFGLVKVQLTKPTARTLYLATTEVHTPGSPPQVWEGVIARWGPIQAPGAFGSHTMDPCSGQFELRAGDRLAYQTGDARLIDAFEDYDWQGALATFYFWEGSLTSASDLQQQLPGRVQTFKISDETITVHVMQQPDDREVPEDVIDDPRAPQKSQGRVLPICYGKLLGLPFRVPPWTAEYGNIAVGPNGLQLIAGGRRAVPGVATDMGRGGDAGGPTRVVFAGHKCKMFGDDAQGAALWMEQAGKRCRMQPGAQVNNCRCSSGVAAITRPSGDFLADGVHKGALVAGAIAASFPAETRITSVAATSLGTSNNATATISVDTVGEFLDIFNDATNGAGLLLGDRASGGTDPITIFIPLLPSNVELVSADNAENPRAVLDAWNDTSYSRLEYGGGGIGQYREWRGRFASLPEAGDLISADLEVGIHLVSGSISGNVKLKVDSGGGSSNEITLPTPSPNPGYVGINLGSTWGTGGLPARWQFGDTIARIYFSASATAILRIYAVGLTLRVRPVGELVGDRVVMVPGVIEKRENAPWFAVGWGKHYVYTEAGQVPGTVPEYGPPQGPFSANLQGWADDDSGTDTGVADALVERAPDIVRHFSKKYGGLSAGDLETASSTFGSLTDLRAELKTWRDRDMEHAFAVLERTPYQAVIEALASDSLCWFHFNRFDGKLHGHAWRPAKSPNYARKIPKDWIAQGRIAVDRAPATEVVVSTRVPYSFDYVGKNMLHEVVLGPGRSSAGHRWRGIRDQFLTVTSGVTDKIDFNYPGIGAITATLTVADYEPLDFAEHAATQMQAGIGGAVRLRIGYGADVKAGAFDQLSFFDGSSTFTITLTPGHMTPVQRAADLQALLAGASTGWTVTHSRTTRKTTIARSGQFTLNFDANNARNGACAIGFQMVNLSHLGAGSDAGDEHEEDRFFISSKDPVAMLWETGANGLNSTAPRNAAVLLGADGARDGAGGMQVSPKGSRETAARIARDQHGGKREWSTAGTTIQDTDTGREISLRAFDLFSVGRDRIRFASSFLPDLELGRVIEFEDDVAELGGGARRVPGRAYIVVEEQQNGMPDSLDMEVLAVDVT